MTVGGGVPGFEQAEYQSRLAAVRARMAPHGLEVCLISTP
jgi:hypothetical protein